MRSRALPLSAVEIVCGELVRNTERIEFDTPWVRPWGEMLEQAPAVFVGGHGCRRLPRRFANERDGNSGRRGLSGIAGTPLSALSPHRRRHRCPGRRSLTPAAWPPSCRPQRASGLPSLRRCRPPHRRYRRWGKHGDRAGRWVCGAGTSCAGSCVCGSRPVVGMLVSPGSCRFPVQRGLWLLLTRKFVTWCTPL